MIDGYIKEEEKEKLNTLARDKFGRTWEDLTDEEKEAIYFDYAGSRDQLEVEYGRAEQLANMETPKGIQAGNVYVASNPLGHIGKAIGQYRGNKKMDEIQGQKKEISDKYAMGSAVGGELAAGDAQQKMAMMAQMMRQQGQPQNAPQAPAQPMAQPQPQAAAAPPRPPLQAAANATPPQPPMQGAGNPMPQMNTGGNVPGTPQEWMAYMMRAQPSFPKKDEEEDKMPGWLKFLNRANPYTWGP